MGLSNASGRRGGGRSVTRWCAATPRYLVTNGVITVRAGRGRRNAFQTKQSPASMVEIRADRQEWDRLSACPYAAGYWVYPA